MHLLATWKKWSQKAKTDILAIFLAVQDERIPWYTKAVALAVVGYAFSPIDLIPDFIPILGYVDDLILLPLGIKLVIKLIPPPILDEYKAKAKTLKADVKRKSWIAGGIIIALWLTIIAVIYFVLK